MATIKTRGSNDRPLSQDGQHHHDDGSAREAHIPGEIGIWLFLLGDAVIFGLLFGAFLVTRSSQVAIFDQSSATLSVTIGAINTMLMLTASLVVVLGVGAVRDGGRRAPPRLFGAAIGCGALFLVNKCIEYGRALDVGHGPSANDFFMYFFVLTGLHAVHVIIGLVVLIVMGHISAKHSISSTRVRAIENGATYWHLVDALWVVLFALLYLVSSG